MMRGDATTGKGSWRRTREGMHISSSYIILLSVYTCGDMEMSTTYTDMLFKTMPRKNNRGRRPESEKKKQIIVHHLYRKRARSTKESRDRLTTPGRSRLPGVKITTYDYLYAKKRAARLYAEQGRKQAPSATKNEIEAVAAAKWARTCVIYTRYTLICIYRLLNSPCAE